MEEFSRTEQLIGQNTLTKLTNSNVAIFGVGGVGGYVCEMLVRAGVGNLTIIDYDVVEKTNINRQIIALHSTIGKPKVEVFKERLLDINPNLNLIVLNVKATQNNIEKLLNNNYDYVVDAIDDVENKVCLIKIAKKLNVNIVSAMGAGNRVGIPNFEVEDIFKTSYDGLAKVMRKKLRENNILNHNVVYTKTNTIKNQNTVGSISYYPAMCGCVISAFVINELIK